MTQWRQACRLGPLPAAANRQESPQMRYRKVRSLVESAFITSFGMLPGERLKR